MDEVMSRRLAAMHAGLDPARLATKLKAMHGSIGDFVRGTAPLFYDRLRDFDLPPSPAVWICGDAHIGNVGLYDAEDGRRLFDLNDFDEALVAPSHFDLLRLLAVVEATAAGGAEMCGRLLKAYRLTAEAGDAAPLDANVQAAPLPELFALAEKRQRRKWLAKRMIETADGWRFAADGDKALPATAAERAALTDLALRLGRQFDRKKFFRPIDAVRRVSGMGSLGRPRFLLAVRGEGDLPRLLDVKGSHPPAPAAPLSNQGGAPDDARRVIEAQSRMLDQPGWPVAAVELLGSGFTVREVQPAAVRLEASLAYPPSLGRVLGSVLAKAHLRGAARIGQADAFRDHAAAAPGWAPEVERLGRRLAARLAEDWHAYRAAFAAGRLS